jgi:alpha-tubulin suppressor-like RCC1 family protein
VLVLDQDGDLWSWGGNYYGQLGRGSDSPDETVYSIKPIFVASFSGIHAIAAGQDHSLAVKKDGTVWYWGFTRYFPDEIKYIFSPTPLQLENTTGGNSVAAGSSHSLALLANGSVLAWGDNADGQLGDGAMTVRSIVSSVLGLTGVTQVSAGNGHALALKEDGTVWAWGAGQNGQLGTDRRANVSRPAKVDLLSSVKRVAAAGSHSLAIKNDGTLWAWGSNYYGQLGDGSTDDRSKPVQVKAKIGGVLQPLANIVAACGGDSHSAAIDSSGTVWRWGYDDEYSADADTNYYYDTAIKVVAIPASKDIACGNGFTLVLANDSTVWAWGDNYYGQLGDGTDLDSYPDTTSYSLQVGGGLTNVSSIAAGSYHSLAIKKDGTLWRWGYSRYDKATDEDKYFPAPVQVNELTQIAAIGAGDWHSLAVKSDGSVYSWGFNWAGQLADGSYEEFRSTPQLAINAAVSGILDLSPTSSNSVTCPIVVQTNKTGSVDAVTAKFRLFIGDQTNCTSTRKRAAGGYQVFVAANDPTSGRWFLLKGLENGAPLPAPTWAQYLGGPLPVFAANAGAGGLDEHVQATLIDGVDTRQLAGFDVYVGYGTDADEMLRANRIKRIFTLGVDGRPVTRK